MKKLAGLVVLVVMIVSVSCEKAGSEYKYPYGSLPDTPVNLTDFNTEFDDYNSSGPVFGSLVHFCFSTNRNNNNFDIIYQPMKIIFDKTSGILSVTNEHLSSGVYADDFNKIKTGLNKIETAGNEFGPNLMIGYDSELYFTLLYSTDISGNAQINYVSNRTISDFSEPREVEFLSSEHEDMYPTFNAENSQVYFCSNRNGENFDFYYVNVNPELDIELLLSDSSNYETYIDYSLSSDADDKCPFIFGDKMVFTSNRDGGFGGFDLYYSILENGVWGEPVNFGDKINTEFDEYRPILIDEDVSFSQTMMVFSSDRTGGLGGFDLYFVGIESK